MVDEQLLARLVVLAHDDIQLPGPLPVVPAEPRIPVPPGIPLPVFVPQQQQGHALAPKFLVDVRPVGDAPVPGLPPGLRRRREQTTLQVGLGQVVRQRPAEADPVQPGQIVAGGVVGDAADTFDLPVAQALPVQPEDLPDLAHGNSLVGHGRLLGKRGGTIPVFIMRRAGPP